MFVPCECAIQSHITTIPAITPPRHHQTLPPCRTLPTHTLPPCRTLPTHTLTPCRTLPTHTLTPCRTLPTHTLNNKQLSSYLSIYINTLSFLIHLYINILACITLPDSCTISSSCKCIDLLAPITPGRCWCLPRYFPHVFMTRSMRFLRVTINPCPESIYSA